MYPVPSLPLRPWKRGFRYVETPVLLWSPFITSLPGSPPPPRPPTPSSLSFFPSPQCSPPLPNSPAFLPKAYISYIYIYLRPQKIGVVERPVVYVCNFAHLSLSASHFGRYLVCRYVLLQNCAVFCRSWALIPYILRSLRFESKSLHRLGVFSPIYTPFFESYVFFSLHQ